jgi:uncharacterized protein (DUF433 family)
MRPIEIHDRGRGPELKGTRTTVYDIIPYRLAGRSPTYIAAAMGHSTEEIEALFRYMDEHYDEVMAVHWRIEERIARGNPPEVEEKLKATRGAARARLEEIRRRNQEQANGDGHPG